LTAVKDAGAPMENSCFMEDAVTLGSGRRRARVALFCLGTLFATATIIAAILIAQARPPARAANLLVIYVGAEDCAPCRAWHGGDGATFRASTDFDRLIYREIRSPRLADVLSEEHWPLDIRTYRNSVRRSDGVPLWLVVSDDVVVEQQFGAEAWRSKILPTIKSYLR
jgi:hypothetical protein